MKTAIYCRVSTRDQTPENQRLELEEYAKRMGYDYEVFEETKSTRKTRPIKNKLFQEAIKGEWDQIIIWKMDRWARSLQELIGDLDTLKKSKVEFYSLKDNLKLDDSATNRLIINVLGCFAQFERDIIRERTIAGLDRARANGKVLGRPHGSKDTKKRCRSGYWQRWANKKNKAIIVN